MVVLSIRAEKYEAPILDKLEWQKGQATYKNNESWKSDYELKENLNENKPNNSKARTPSSGEEKKPKFWDFKVVK